MPLGPGQMAVGIGRREFIGALSGAVAWPLTARAQLPAMALIGYLSSRLSSDSTDTLKRSLILMGRHS